MRQYRTFLTASLLVSAISAAPTNSIVLVKNGTTSVTPELKTTYLSEAKADLLKAAADSGFTIRPSTLSYIDNSAYLAPYVYGVLTKPDPSVIRNIDSLLIQSELAGDPDFWKTHENILLATAFGRRGFGVGEVKQWERKISLNTEALASAQKAGVSFAEWQGNIYDSNNSAAATRRETNKDVLTAIQNKILSWVGSVQVSAIDKGPDIIGGKAAGVLENDKFLYAQVYGTDSLKDSITALITGTAYNGNPAQALYDTRDWFNPEIGKPRQTVPALYDYFKDLITWQTTPKADLKWNPAAVQSKITAMKHPVYSVNAAPWELLLPLTTALQKNEVDFIREIYLGYHKRENASSQDTVNKVYVPAIHSYGPYRSGDLTKWYLISYPVKGYASAITGGGVCGTMSGIATEAYTALGKPMYKAGQPGHSNIVYYDQTETGLNSAAVGQSVSIDEYTTCGNLFRDGELFWNLSTSYDASSVNHRGLAYAANVGEESWLESRIAYSIFKQMSKEDRQTYGIPLLADALSKNAGYTEAVFALFNEALQVDDSLFIAVYDTIISSINQKIATMSDATVITESRCYRDLLTYTLLECGFTDSNLWPASASEGLSAWLKTFVLEATPDVSTNEYNKQNERKWRWSELARTDLTKFETRVMENVKVIGPDLIDSTNYLNTDFNVSRLVDGNIATRYKTTIGKQVAVSEPYEFTFIFPDSVPTVGMVMNHSSISNNMLVKDYELYWSTDSVNWSGPMTGSFTTAKEQKVLFDSDTTITPEHSVELKDSNGVVFDTTVVPADTVVVNNGVMMKYLRYVPKTSHVNNPFIGIIALEFGFTYKPVSSNVVAVSLKKSTAPALVSIRPNAVIVSSTVTEPIRLFTVNGRLVAEIKPQDIGGSTLYTLDSRLLSRQFYLISFPKSLNLKPVKFHF